MKTTQPQLPAMPRDWTQPQFLEGSELAGVIRQAEAAGFYAARTEVLRPIAYRVQFQRLPTNATR